MMKPVTEQDATSGIVASAVRCVQFLTMVYGSHQSTVRRIRCGLPRGIFQ
jgi:hypothetical protein